MNPLAQTGRLDIVPLMPTHLAGLVRVLTDPQTMSFWPAVPDRAHVEAWVARSRDSFAARGYGRCALIRRADGDLIGDVGMVAAVLDGESVVDLGWILHRDHWGQGYATEAARALVEVAFGKLDLPALHANMAVDHIASRRVAERIGMVRVRRFNNPRNRNLLTELFRLDRPERALNRLARQVRVP